MAVCCDTKYFSHIWFMIKFKAHLSVRLNVVLILCFGSCICRYYRGILECIMLKFWLKLEKVIKKSILGGHVLSQGRPCQACVI